MSSNQWVNPALSNSFRPVRRLEATPTAPDSASRSDPLNFEARKKRDELLRACQDRIRYTFKRPLLLWEALQGAESEVLSIEGRRIPQHNLRLAYIGDAVLMLALRMQSIARGDLTSAATKMCQYTATNEYLTQVGLAAGIHQMINTKDDMTRLWGPHGKSVADTMEAILGAVFLDGGIDKVIAVMGQLGIVLPASPGEVPRSNRHLTAAQRFQQRLQLEEKMAVNSLVEAERRHQAVNDILIASNQAEFTSSLGTQPPRRILARSRQGDQYRPAYTDPPRPVWTEVNVPPAPTVHRQEVRRPSVPLNIPQHRVILESAPLPPKETAKGMPTEAAQVSAITNLTQDSLPVQEEEISDGHLFGLGSIKALLNKVGKASDCRFLEPAKSAQPIESVPKSVPQVGTLGKALPACKFGMAGFPSVLSKSMPTPQTASKPQIAVGPRPLVESVVAPIDIDTNAIDAMEDEDDWLKDYMDHMIRKHSFNFRPVTPKEVQKAKAMLARVCGEEVRIRKAVAHRSIDFGGLLGYLPAGYYGQKRRKLNEFGEAGSVSETDGSQSSEHTS